MGEIRKRRLWGIFLLAILLLGMGRAPRKESPVPQGMVLQVMVEDALAEMEYAYASRKAEEFMNLLDNDFEARERFRASLQSYFLYLERPHLHFVIEMIIADKNGIKVTLRWFRRALTPSQVAIKQQGKAQLLFKRYPDGLKLKGIGKENPFF